MHSSDSIAQLAGALARAQVELVNPAKSLTATFEQGSGRGAGQTYRYAPLSSGLDIIRKALGQQEIAVLQTTHVEQGHGPAEGGLLVLTTTLAHASGEWVATTWPVCRLTDVSDPKLLGAALTYARRYSLFALVGITGDDDLDAPDLTGGVHTKEAVAVPPREATPATVHSPAMQTRTRAEAPLQRVRGRITGDTQAHAPSPALASPASAVSASDLLMSLEAAQDETTLLVWAKDALLVRTSLDAAERGELNQSFLRRAQAIGADPELLSAFTQPTHDDNPGPLPSPAPTPEGGHDAQAAL
jgi:hypothetical protein